MQKKFCCPAQLIQNFQIIDPPPLLFIQSPQLDTRPDNNLASESLSKQVATENRRPAYSRNRSLTRTPTHTLTWIKSEAGVHVNSTLWDRKHNDVVKQPAGRAGHTRSPQRLMIFTKRGVRQVPQVWQPCAQNGSPVNWNNAYLDSR